jgi:hypothetical protein
MFSSSAANVSLLDHMLNAQLLIYFSPSRWKFVFLAAPNITNLFGQAFFTLKMWQRLTNGREKHTGRVTYNVLRAGGLIISLLICAIACASNLATPRQQRTISSAFLAIFAILPTALIKETALRKVFRRARPGNISDSGSEIALTPIPPPPRGEHNVSVIVSGQGFHAEPYSAGDREDVERELPQPTTVSRDETSQTSQAPRPRLSRSLSPLLPPPSSLPPPPPSLQSIAALSESVSDNGSRRFSCNFRN